MKKIIVFLVICILLISTSFASYEDDIIQLWVPEYNFAFELNVSGLNIESQQIRDDLTGRFLSLDHSNNDIYVTVFIKPISFGFTSVQYRDSMLMVDQEKIPFDLKVMDLKKYEQAGLAIAEYNLKNDGNSENENLKNFSQLNRYIYLIKDSLGINIHISSVKPKNEVIDKFDFLTNSLKIIDSYQPSAFDYFIFGSWCYNNNNLPSAIRFYEQGLEIEKQEPVLPQSYWLVLVDNLGMSYGISGDYKNAQRIFEYGLTVEPTYPMFHYNIACNYAEMKELDSALIALEKAFLYKENMISGETFPDPYEDNSFKRYWYNMQFEKLMSKLNK